MNEAAKVIKVAILGDSGVGKTALMRGFINGNFPQLHETVGLDYKTREVKMRKTSVITQIWDTSGHLKNSEVWPRYYQDADCCVLVFSLDNLGTFISLEEWKSLFLAKCRPRYPVKFPFFIVGNKVDLPNSRQIPAEWKSRGCIPWVGNDENCFCIETAATSHRYEKFFRIIVDKAFEYSQQCNQLSQQCPLTAVYPVELSSCL